VLKQATVAGQYASVKRVNTGSLRLRVLTITLVENGIENTHAAVVPIDIAVDASKKRQISRLYQL
jgi:hypothetical protein